MTLSLPRPAGRAATAALALVALGSAGALAQTNPLPSRDLPLRVESAVAQNLGTRTETVLTLHVSQPGAPWMRLLFSDVQLSGDVAAGTGSVLKITSLLDGHYQLLNARTIHEWQHSSAYFNGDLLLLEVIAQPGTGRNQVIVDGVTVGLLPPGFEDSICGPSDDRELSNDPRASRLMPIGCTSWLIDDACGCFLTAGHCTGSANVVQFNVPLSNSNGSTNMPPPSDQYTVDRTSLQTNGGRGVGNDYAYFGVFPNSTTGLTAKQAQGATYTLAAPPAWNSSLQVRITGYGVDGGVRNQVQQTHVGPWLSYSSGNTALDYQTDTQGGNSGSPVIQEQSGVAMGIHTHGGCSSGGGSNHGTASIHPGLQAFIANPLGVCLKLTCGTAATAVVRNGSGINPLCLSSLSLPEIGTSWQLQVDASTVPGAAFSVVRCQAPTTGPVVGIGEFLIDLSTTICFQSEAIGGGQNVHSIPVPPNVGIAGFSSTVQAAVGVPGSGLVQLCNAIDFTVGCTQ